MLFSPWLLKSPVYDPDFSSPNISKPATSKAEAYTEKPQTPNRAQISHTLQAPSIFLPSASSPKPFNVNPKMQNSHIKSPKCRTPTSNPKGTSPNCQLLRCEVDDRTCAALGVSTGGFVRASPKVPQVKSKQTILYCAVLYYTIGC